MSLFFAKFCFLQFLRLQLTLASYRSYSLRFRFSLFYKSEISLLEISLCSLLSFVPLRSSSLRTRLPDFIRPKFRLLKFAFGSVSHKLRLSPICFFPRLFGFVSPYPTQISQKKRRTQGFVSEKQVTMYIRQKCLLNQR